MATNLNEDHIDYGAEWVVQYSQIDSIGVSGDKKGLHWYQWYDRYQWKSTLFQWFYW